MPNGKIPTRRRREETESGDCQKELDDLEYEHAMEAEMVGKSYDYIIDKDFRWSSWAAPKMADNT